MRRETRYAKSDGLSIAWQVAGHGPIDLVFVMGWVSNIEMFWREPHFARFLDRLAAFSRLIVFDKRGTGLSDRPTFVPSMEERMDDVRAVMDAAGSERAALFGLSEGGPLCALFAATYPERTSKLIIDSGYARSMWAPDYPWGRTEEMRDRYFAYLETHWGGDVMLHRRAPGLADDPAFREWWSDYLRMSASPGAAVAFSRMNWQIDIRHVLPTIRVPTLVIHRERDAAMPVEHGRYLAEHIPTARYVELPGDDHLPFTGDADAVLDAVEPFLTGAEPARRAHPVLATVMVVQIVEAMAIAARIGERAWRERLAAYAAVVHEELAHHRGLAAGATGASTMAAFDGPARALRCAAAIVARARDLDLLVRSALHTGEIDGVGNVRGAACQVAVRLLERAAPGEVVVSRTIIDLVAGSGVTFSPLGQTLATTDGRRLEIFRIAAIAPRPTAIPAPAPARGGVPLTRRETEVATLIGRGLSNRQIADTLFISIATVERHAANIFGKLALHSRTQVAVWAAEQGLLVAAPR